MFSEYKYPSKLKRPYVHYLRHLLVLAIYRGTLSKRMTSTAVVNDEGIQLAYIDSRPPEGMEVYRTLITAHGHG
jgi:hypothetical protein